MMNNEPTQAAIDQIELEYHKACSKHAAMHSAHEGFVVIYEEMLELFDEIRRQERNPQAMAHEAAQVGAMALRFLVDICGNGDRA